MGPVIDFICKHEFLKSEAGSFRKSVEETKDYMHMQQKKNIL